MHKQKLLFVAATLLFTSTQIHAQDITEGSVLAFDRKANVLVLSDKTVWPLERLTSPLPDGLKAGNRIEIRYQANDDSGIATIFRIKIIN